MSFSRLGSRTLPLHVTVEVVDSEDRGLVVVVEVLHLLPRDPLCRASHDRSLWAGAI